MADDVALDTFWEKEFEILFGAGLCTLPLLTEYAEYAINSTKQRPSDETINNLFDKIDKVVHNTFKDEEGKPLTGSSKFCQGEWATLTGYRDICPCLKVVEKAKTRMDKVEAIEQVISAQHTEGEGPVLQYGCTSHILPRDVRMAFGSYEQRLSTLLLDFFFEGGK